MFCFGHASVFYNKIVNTCWWIKKCTGMNRKLALPAAGVTYLQNVIKLWPISAFRRNRGVVMVFELMLTLFLFVGLWGGTQWLMYINKHLHELGHQHRFVTAVTLPCLFQVSDGKWMNINFVSSQWIIRARLFPLESVMNTIMLICTVGMTSASKEFVSTKT